MYKALAGCKYYISPGSGYRDIIPVGTELEIIGSSTIGSTTWVQISGQDPNPWRGKWVRSNNVVEIAGPPPEPPPDVEIDPSDVMIHQVDGVEVERFYRQV